jgi:hypothetical protein
MKTVSELKEEREKRNSELFKKVGLFFAFSNSQFEENKTPLKEGEKYVSIGGGGYMPKGNIEIFENGLKEIKNWYNGEINKNKAQDKEIIHELYNHECFYTGDVSDVVEMFKDRYSSKRIVNLFIKERKKAYQS